MTDAEKKALAIIAGRLRQGRSSRATIALSELVADGDAWRLPRVQTKRGSGTRCWWKLCRLRLYFKRAGMLPELRAIFQYLEGREDVDRVALKRGREMLVGWGCAAPCQASTVYSSGTPALRQPAKIVASDKARSLGPA